MLEENLTPGQPSIRGGDCTPLVSYCIVLPDNQRSKLEHHDCKSRATFFAVSLKKSREGNGALYLTSAFGGQRSIS